MPPSASSEEVDDEEGALTAPSPAAAPPAPSPDPPMNDETGALIVDFGNGGLVQQATTDDFSQCAQNGVICKAGHVCVQQSGTGRSDCRVPPEGVGDGGFCCASAVAQDCTGPVFDERRGTPGVCGQGLTCDQQSRSCSVNQ